MANNKTDITMWNLKTHFDPVKSPEFWSVLFEDLKKVVEICNKWEDNHYFVGQRVINAVNDLKKRISKDDWSNVKVLIENERVIVVWPGKLNRIMMEFINEPVTAPKT